MKNLAIMAGIMILLCACSQHNQNIKAPGLVDGDIINIKSLAGGTVKDLAVSEGQALKKGDLILRLDTDKIDNALDGLDIGLQEIANTRDRTNKKIILVKANLAYLEKQSQHFERLLQKQAVSGDQVDKLRLQLLEVRNSLFDLEKTLESLKIQQDKIANQRQSLILQRQDLELTAPSDGIVLEKFISLGETVLPGTVLLELLNPDSLYVDVYVEENEISQLALNQSTQVWVDGRAEPLTGVISYFGKKAEFSPKYVLSEKERQSLLFQVKVRLDNRSQIFKIGMPVTVIFGTKAGTKL